MELGKGFKNFILFPPEAIFQFELTLTVINKIVKINRTSGDIHHLTGDDFSPVPLPPALLW